MAYFFVPPEQIREKTVTFAGSDTVHLTRVLRLKPGDLVTVCDGCGKGYRVRLSRTAPEVQGVIEEEFLVGAESPVAVTLVQGIPKGDKMELIIQKCTELGVKQIIPFPAERSVVRLDPDRLRQKTLRWQKVAGEAAKQCRRGEIPVVRPMLLPEVFAAMPSGAVGIMPWEGEREVSLKEALRRARGAREFFLFIGPEGGLAPGEVELAKSRRVATVSLGGRILRTETAALAAVAVILYEIGDLGG